MSTVFQIEQDRGPEAPIYVRPQTSQRFGTVHGVGLTRSLLIRVYTSMFHVVTVTNLIGPIPDKVSQNYCQKSNRKMALKSSRIGRTYIHRELPWAFVHWLSMDWSAVHRSFPLRAFHWDELQRQISFFLKTRRLGAQFLFTTQRLRLGWVTGRFLNHHYQVSLFHGPGDHQDPSQI